MIHLKNNSQNIITFVETLPRNYVLQLEHKQTRSKFAYAVTNDLISNTQSVVTITNILAGEYIYSIEADNRVYEVGIAKVPADNVVEKITYKQSNTYKSYVRKN